MFKFFFGLSIFLIVLSSCNIGNDRLPIFGERTPVKKVVNGKEIIDTIYQTVPPFRFIDQDSNIVTNETFKNKIYIADFVFISCRTICPKMNVQMKRLYDIYKDNPEVLFLSHTIDPERDTLARIREYMTLNKAVSSKWHMVRGEEEEVLKIANQGYFSIAFKDSLNKEPGQEYQHSGWMVLVDKLGRVRSMKDGTDQFQVDALVKDIGLLLKEED